MMSIWEKCQSEDATLNEIVSAYEAAGNAGELVSVVRNDGDRASALYVLAELRTDLTRPVWRCALPYASDPDDRTASNALDIFHSFTAEAEAEDLLIVLRSTNLASPGLFAKLFAIMLSVRPDLLRRSSDLAHERDLGTHGTGLTLLVGDSWVPSSEARLMLKSDDLVTRFYACCLVGRQHSRYPSLHRSLPARVKRRLLLHIEGEELRQSLQSDRR